MKQLSKVQAIWQFINFNHPTRTELNMFIMGIKAEDYDNIKNSGYYGTNIAEWKRKGHIEVIDKKYTITPESLGDGSGRMYIELPSVNKAKLLRIETINSFHQRENNYRLKERELREGIYELRYKLEQIQQLSRACV